MSAADGPTDAAAVRITRVTAPPRFEAWVGDRLAGFLKVDERPTGVVLVHTEVDPAFRGRGIAGQLAVAALEDARARGVHVIARCPFVTEYLEDHPEYQDLLA